MEKPKLELKLGQRVRARRPRIYPLVKVHVKTGNYVETKWGIISGQELYIVKRTLLGWKPTGEKYLVKNEHFYVEKIQKRNKYIVYYSIVVEAGSGVSLPPPGSNISPWTQEEVTMVARVLSNVMITKMLEEERKRLNAMMERLQRYVLYMFIGMMIFVGFIYWYSGQVIANSVAEAVKQMFPAPTP